MGRGGTARVCDDAFGAGCAQISRAGQAALRAGEPVQGDWRDMLKKGFVECFRVLKPNGTLIFKWSDVQFPVKEILKLTDYKPLYGHKSGKKMNTHWICFIKD